MKHPPSPLLRGRAALCNQILHRYAPLNDIKHASHTPLKGIITNTTQNSKLRTQKNVQKRNHPKDHPFAGDYPHRHCHHLRNYLLHRPDAINESLQMSAPTHAGAGIFL